MATEETAVPVMGASEAVQPQSSFTKKRRDTKWGITSKDTQAEVQEWLGELRILALESQKLEQKRKQSVAQRMTLERREEAAVQRSQLLEQERREQQKRQEQFQLHRNQLLVEIRQMSEENKLKIAENDKSYKDNVIKIKFFRSEQKFQKEKEREKQLAKNKLEKEELQRRKAEEREKLKVQRDTELSLVRTRKAEHKVKFQEIKEKQEHKRRSMFQHLRETDKQWHEVHAEMQQKHLQEMKSSVEKLDVKHQELKKKLEERRIKQQENLLNIKKQRETEKNQAKLLKTKRVAENRELVQTLRRNAKQNKESTTREKEHDEDPDAEQAYGSVSSATKLEREEIRQNKRVAAEGLRAATQLRYQERRERQAAEVERRLKLEENQREARQKLLLQRQFIRDQKREQEQQRRDLVLKMRNSVNLQHFELQESAEEIDNDGTRKFQNQ